MKNPIKKIFSIILILIAGGMFCFLNAQDNAAKSANAPSSAVNAQAPAGNAAAPAAVNNASAPAAAANPATPAKTPGAEKNKWVALYESRVDGFKKECAEISANKEKLDKGQIVMLGDSITQGFKLEDHFPGKSFVNRGIASDHLFWLPPYESMGVMNRISPDVLAPNPTKIFILIGINDINYSYQNKKELYFQKYKEMLTTLKKTYPKAKIFTQSLLPTREKYAKFKQPVLEFNELLKKLTAEEGCTYINLHPLMIDENGDLKKEFTRDGLHITNDAYKIWKAEIEKY